MIRTQAQDQPKFTVDAETRARMLRGLKAMFKSEYGMKVTLLSVALVVLSLSINVLNVINSYVGRDFITAIESRDTNEFIKQAIIYLSVFAGSTITAVIFRYSEERLGLVCRDWLTQRMISLYLNNQVYYRLINDEAIGNPDQRIADDVKSATVTSLSIILMLLNSFFAVVAFSGVLWTISPTLFVVSVLYALAGSACTFWLGRSLIGLNYAQLDKEANFRSDLIHVREHAESIVLLGRESRLCARILNHLNDLIDNYHKIIRVNRNMGFFTTGYNYLIQIIPALIVGPLFMAGKVEFGVVTQSAMAFAVLLGAFSVFITNFQAISNYTAVLARLTGLSHAMEKETSHGECSPIFHNEASSDAESCNLELPKRSIDDIQKSAMNPINFICDNRFIRYEGLTLLSPNADNVLISNLNLEIERGSRLLVIGAQESPKLALLRATAGIWDTGYGQIYRPDANSLSFLPEKPYMPPGSFRELIVSTEGKITPETDHNILGILKRLDAEDILQRIGGLDVVCNWDEALSISEQQLLACARLIYTAPRFAILDRPNTALMPDELGNVLELLNEHEISYITMGRTRHGQRDTDDKLSDYDHVLSLEEDGSWHFYPVSEMRP